MTTFRLLDSRNIVKKKSKGNRQVIEFGLNYKYLSKWIHEKGSCVYLGESFLEIPMEKYFFVSDLKFFILPLLG